MMIICLVHITKKQAKHVLGYRSNRNCNYTKVHLLRQLLTFLYLAEVDVYLISAKYAPACISLEENVQNETIVVTFIVILNGI